MRSFIGLSQVRFIENIGLTSDLVVAAMTFSSGNRHKCRWSKLGMYILTLTSISEGLDKQQEEKLKELSSYPPETKPNTGFYQ